MSFLGRSRFSDVLFVTIASVLVPSMPAKAEWHNWVNHGGTLESSVSCTSWSLNRLDCFARGLGGNMMQRWWDGQSWNSWYPHEGSIHGAPSCVSWGLDRIDCFARNAQGELIQRWWDGQQWKGWFNHHGDLQSDPSCVSWGTNRLDCFAKASTGNMIQKYWDGSRWSDWVNHGGQITEQPSCVSWGPNRIDCFARGAGGAMHQLWWDGHTWNGWHDHGGRLNSPPSCLSWGPNRLDCFARSSNDTLIQKWWDGTQWHEWFDHGGNVASDPSCTNWGPNRLDCFARDGGNRLKHKWWDGTRWNDWFDHRGAFMGSPTCISWGPNRIDCFARGLDRAMIHKWWSEAPATGVRAMRLMFEQNCNASMRSFNERAALYGRAVVGSPAFEQCVRDRVPSHYRSCRADPWESSPALMQANKAIEAARSSNQMLIACEGGRGNASASVGAYGHGDAVRFAWSGWLRTQVETLNAPLCNGNNAPCRFAPEPWPWSQAAGIIWHEAMHTHGYVHGNSGAATLEQQNAENREQCGQSSNPDWNFQANTMPYVLDKCLTEIIDASQRACGELRSCGSENRLKLVDRLDGTSCSCRSDP